MAEAGDDPADSSRHDVSIAALTFPSRNVISRYLNPTLTSEVKSGRAKGLSPDWRGFAELIGADYLTIKNLDKNEDRMFALLNKWLNNTDFVDATVANLLKFLNQLERRDCLEELSWYLERDVRTYRKNKRLGFDDESPLQDPEVSSVSDWTDHRFNEFEMMCVDDKPGNPSTFDAFVCHADQDIAFVKDMIQILESSPHNLKLCVPDRDMLAGSSTYNIISKIMAERCRRIIIVVSPEFYDSAMCDYQIKFAFTLNPGKNTSQFLPVICKEKTYPFPPVLRPFTKLDYTKKELRLWFWDRLADVISSPLTVSNLPVRNKEPDEDTDDLDKFVMVDSEYVSTNCAEPMCVERFDRSGSNSPMGSVESSNFSGSWSPPIDPCESVLDDENLNTDFVFVDPEIDEHVSTNPQLPRSWRTAFRSKSEPSKTEKRKDKKGRSNSFELQMMNSC